MVFCCRLPLTRGNGGFRVDDHHHSVAERRRTGVGALFRDVGVSDSTI